MRREQLHREISENLEPSHLLGNPEDHIAILGEWLCSPNGFWLAVSYYEENDIAKWEGIDYSRSEEASAKLLEATNGKGWYIEVGYDPTRKQWDAAFMERGAAVAFREEHPDRKTAILLAAAAWLKIDVDELED